MRRWRRPRGGPQIIKWFIIGVKGPASSISGSRARFWRLGFLGAGGGDRTGDHSMAGTTPCPLGHGFPDPSENTNTNVNTDMNTKPNVNIDAYEYKYKYLCV